MKKKKNMKKSKKNKRSKKNRKLEKNNLTPWRCFLNPALEGTVLLLLLISIISILVDLPREPISSILGVIWFIISSFILTGIIAIITYEVHRKKFLSVEDYFKKFGLLLRKVMPDLWITYFVSSILIVFFSLFLLLLVFVMIISKTPMWLTTLFSLLIFFVIITILSMWLLLMFKYAKNILEDNRDLGQVLRQVWSRKGFKYAWLLIAVSIVYAIIFGIIIAFFSIPLFTNYNFVYDSIFTAFLYLVTALYSFIIYSVASLISERI